MKRIKRLSALMFAAVLIITAVLSLSVQASAVTYSYNKDMLRGIKVTDNDVNHYEALKIYSGGKVLGAYLINSTTYIPLRAFYDSQISSDITYNASTRTARVKNAYLDMTVKDGDYYVIANGRYLWTDNPAVILSDGRIYVPIRILAKTVGLGVIWDNKTRSVSIDGKVSYIQSGDSFYNKDDLYWLSRIISAESRGEPFLGQIAVGNIVMNRVRSKSYPNSIYGVIFDKKYGTQFSPVSFGTIYNTPSAQSVIAAKICLEGTSVSEDILFFYNAAIATTSWIDRARPYAFTIKNHRFYY